MFSFRSPKYLISAILLSLVIIISAACSNSKLITSPEAQTQESASEEGINEILPIVFCPTDPTRFLITYFHYQHLYIDPGTGEIIDLTFENSDDPAQIQVWIDENGIITPYEGNTDAPITVSGKAEHPDSDDCRVQEFSGEWDLSTDLSGKCTNGKIRIEIEHFYKNTDLPSSCGETPSLITDIVSGPEQTLNFDLAENIPSNIIEYGEGTFLHVKFAYYFTRDETFLQIVPLVPESE